MTTSHLTVFYQMNSVQAFLFCFFPSISCLSPPPQKKLNESEIQIYATTEGVFMRSSMNIFTRVLLSSLNVYFHDPRLFREHCDEVSTLKQTSDEQINWMCN